jgi:hypothetical protein
MDCGKQCNRTQPGSAVRVFRVVTGLCRGESRGEQEEQRRGSYRKERPLLFACQALVTVPSPASQSASAMTRASFSPAAASCEVFRLGYWFPRLSETVRRQLVTEIVSLMREGILATSSEMQSFPLDDIGTAVEQAASTSPHGKVRPVIGCSCVPSEGPGGPIGFMPWDGIIPFKGQVPLTCHLNVRKPA